MRDLLLLAGSIFRLLSQLLRDARNLDVGIPCDEVMTSGWLNWKATHRPKRVHRLYGEEQRWGSEGVEVDIFLSGDVVPAGGWKEKEPSLLIGCLSCEG